MIDDEEFFAWLDGELDDEAAARVAAMVAQSPELTARAEQHRRLASDLQGAFAPVVDAPSEPPRFQTAEVIKFGPRAAAPQRQWSSSSQWMAMAASLVIGVALGSQLFGSRAEAPVAVEGGRLVAASALGAALDERLASAPQSDGPRVGLTFRDSQGRICRSFTAAEASGLACRQGDAWQLEGLFRPAEGQSTDYRMAAGADPRLATLVEGMISGEPFSAAQEQEAKRRGWN